MVNFSQVRNGKLGSKAESKWMFSTLPPPPLAGLTVSPTPKQTKSFNEWYQQQQKEVTKQQQAEDNATALDPPGQRCPFLTRGW